MADEWVIYSLVSVSALVLCVSSALLYARYNRREVACAHEPEQDADTREEYKIMYGTQTGTAEKFAKQAASALDAKYGGQARFTVVDVEDFDHANMGTEKLMMFMLATYGDGEPTDNAVSLDEWLQSAADDVMNGDRSDILEVHVMRTKLLTPSLKHCFCHECMQSWLHLCSRCAGHAIRCVRAWQPTVRALQRDRKACLQELEHYRRESCCEAGSR